MAPRVVATAVKPSAGGFWGRVGDSKRSGAHTREPALRTEGAGGRRGRRRGGGGGGGWWRLSVHGVPVLISLVHPLPQESPLDHGKRRVDRVGKMSACVHTK